MAEVAEIPGVSKFESTLLVLFIPSVDRKMAAIDQQHWERAALEALGTWFGGATAFPRGKGVWRDDARGGKLVYDKPVVFHCYTSWDAIREHMGDLHGFLMQMGTATNQGAVGFVIADTYYEIDFPLKKRGRKHGKGQISQDDA